MPAARLARDGVELNLEQAFFIEILAPILTHYEETAAIYAPGGVAAASGRPVSLPRARRRPRAARHRGGAAVLRGRDRTARERLGARAWRHSRCGRPRRLRADRPRPRAGRLSRPRGADQPTAFLGRLADRLRARAARSKQRRQPRDRGDRRRDADSAVGAHARVSRRPVRGRLRRSFPLRRPSRLDDSHHGGRRRRVVCERHLLERNGLGSDRPRRPGSTSTTCSARRI